ncbi:MAG: choice-of-anchor D domain-containing protein [Betaproteobacteria bacterium]|nr:choice-of-anchor D domain-containing protein [Betaproteobacteria bacterium]
MSVNFTNSGNGSLTIGNAALTGPAAASYQVIADGCAGQTLTAVPVTSCAISLAMQPQAAGTLAATLLVASDATNPTLAVSLTGTGSAIPVAPPAVAATPPGPVDFGSHRVGTQSPPTTFTLAPSAAGPVSISSISLLGSGFSVVSDTCTGTTIAQGSTPASCTFSVIFTPNVEGQYRISLQVLSNATNPQLLLDLSGTGTPLPVGRLGASPPTVFFGTQPIGVATGAQAVQVVNTGTLPVTVGAVRATGDFTQTNDCHIINVGQGCRALVAFTATQEGERSGTLTIESDAVNPQLDVFLVGRGSPAPVPIVELSPGAVTFGTSFMGSGGNGTLVTLRNAGGVSLELGRIYTIGDFSVTHACPASLPPSASCAVTVGFSPSITGARAGKLVVESNAAAGVKEAALSGTGCRNFGLGTSRLAAPTCK